MKKKTNQASAQAEVKPAPFQTELAKRLNPMLIKSGLFTEFGYFLDEKGKINFFAVPKIIFKDMAKTLEEAEGFAYFFPIPEEADLEERDTFELKVAEFLKKFILLYLEGGRKVLHVNKGG